MRRTLVRILQRLQPTTVPRRISTSLSDNQAYPQVCLQAANDYRFFNEFRTNSVYNQILEHVSEQHGGEYLRLIAQDPEVLGGEPCVKGTRIPAYLVGALARKHGFAEVRATYPSLSRQTIELVALYVEAHPRKGRPRQAELSAPKGAARRGKAKKVRLERASRAAASVRAAD